MNYKVDYPICQLHEQPLNFICLRNNCKDDRIICALCRQQRHPETHYTIPLKIYLRRKIHKFRCLSPSVISQIEQSLLEQKKKLSGTLDCLKRRMEEYIGSAKEDIEHFYNKKIQALTKCKELRDISDDQLSHLDFIQNILGIAANYQDYQQSALDKLKLATSKITESLQGLRIDLNSQSPYKWMGNQEIDIESNILTSKNDSYKVAYYSKPLSLKAIQMSFNILKGGDNLWIAIGICHENIVKKRNYMFRYHTIGHGVYAISSNGGSWSHHKPQYNNKLCSFNFCKNEPVTVSYDASVNKAAFSLESGEKYFLQIDPKQKGNLHFCVVLYYKGCVIETSTQFNSIN